MSEIKLPKILKAVGHEDAIKILRLARQGFEGRTDVNEKLGLSVKRYYYRLEKLMDAGIVIRMNQRYELTPLGVAVYDAVLYIIGAMET